MQLILSNSDLVAAVTAFLGNVITVNETATIQVELTEDGAVVEITPSGQAAPVKEARVVKTRGPRKATVEAGKMSITEAPIVETPVVEKPTVEVATEETAVAEQNTASPGVTTGGVANPLPGDSEEEQEQEEAEEPVVEPKPVNKATSLFAGLNRPKN